MIRKSVELLHTAVALVLALVLVQPTWSQVPIPASMPDIHLAKGGEVYAVVVQPDGGVVFGGLFTEVNGTARSNIARLLPDGTLDQNWNPVIDNAVLAMAVDDVGHVYVGGMFEAVDTTGRRHVARLDGASGEVDAHWNPSANEAVRAIAVDNAGSVFVGGDFSEVHSAYYDRVAKIPADGDGTPDSTWLGRSATPVGALAVDDQGSLYATGHFVVGDNLRELAKLSTLTGVADSTWDPQDLGQAMSIVVSGSHVYVGTPFSLAKLATSGPAASEVVWEWMFRGTIRAVAVADGRVYVGGMSSDANGQWSPFLVRLFDSNGTVDASWSPSPDNAVYALVVRGDGQVFAGGIFTQLGSDYRLGLAALLPSGSPNAAIDVERRARVNSLVAQPDGKLVVGGDFLKADGTSHRNLLRIGVDGRIDPSWSPAANGPVRALVLGDDGAIYAGGEFSSVNGLVRGHLVKLAGSGNGEVDASWAPQVDGNVLALALGGDQSIIVGGSFGSLGNVQRQNIAKIAATGVGALDAGWLTAGANGEVLSLARDGTAIYAGGGFTSIGGQSRNRVAKLVATGAGEIDLSWQASASDVVQTILVGADESIFLGGRFSVVNGTNRSGVAKLSAATGLLDPVWQPGFYSTFPIGGHKVMSLALTQDGSLFVGGLFDYVSGSGSTCRYLAKVSANGAGAFAPNWCPAFDGGIYALAMAPTDTLYAGGQFRTVANVQRDALVAFKSTLIFANGVD